jgi:hypothetical protein
MEIATERCGDITRFITICYFSPKKSTHIDLFSTEREVDRIRKKSLQRESAPLW